MRRNPSDKLKWKAMTKNLPYGKQTTDPEDIKAVSQVPQKILFLMWSDY